MSKHTKGPWYGADKPVFGWWTIYSSHSIGGTECINGRQAIATIPAASKKNDSEYAEMFAANARLIAAAPELLAACEAFLEYDNCAPEDDIMAMLQYGDVKSLVINAIHKVNYKP